MKITILGCGTPTPVPEAYGSSWVVEASGQKLLFDCGPATTHKLVKAGISPVEIDHLFFTHHHFDHDSDFPAFVLTRWDQNVPRDRVLNVYGPAFTREFTEGVLDEEKGLFRKDWIARVEHPASHVTYTDRGGVLPRKKPMVNVTEIGPGDVIEGDGWSVRAAHAEHVQPYLDSVAYRVESGGRSVVLTGDTHPCDSITELARGVDVLLMMCWETADLMGGTGHEMCSSSIKGVTETARAAAVKQLVMVHIGNRLRRPDMLARRQAEADAVGYDGPIIWGEELMEVPLPD